MNTTVKNVLAVIAGLVIGSAVNMGIIMISGSIIPPPEGADITTMKGLIESMHLMGPQHFIFPFLAHALGTLVDSKSTKTMITHIGKLFDLPCLRPSKSE